MHYILCFSLSWLHSPILLPCPERKQASSQIAINNNNNNKNSNINYNNSKETKSAKSGDSTWIPGEHKTVKVEAGSVQGPSDECSQGFSDGRGQGCIEEGFQGPSEEEREGREDEGSGDPEAEKIKEQHLDCNTLLLQTSSKKKS